MCEDGENGQLRSVVGQRRPAAVRALGVSVSLLLSACGGDGAADPARDAAPAFSPAAAEDPPIDLELGRTITEGDIEAFRETLADLGPAGVLLGRRVGVPNESFGMPVAGTPLELIMKLDRAEFLAALLDAGLPAAPDPDDEFPDIPLLEDAARENAADTVRMLAGRGVGPGDPGGRSPYWWAARGAAPDAFLALQEVGVPLDRDDPSLLEAAVGGGETVEAATAMVELLLAEGLPAPASAEALRTAAIWVRHAGAVRAILAAGADPNTRVNNASTPLISALYSGSGFSEERAEEVLRALLDGGADPNFPAGSGDTPLKVAIDQVRSPRLAAFLVTHGADTASVDRRGSSAFCVAESKGLREVALAMARALRDAGRWEEVERQFQTMPPPCRTFIRSVATEVLAEPL